MGGAELDRCSIAPANAWSISLLTLEAAATAAAEPDDGESPLLPGAAPHTRPPAGAEPPLDAEQAPVTTVALARNAAAALLLAVPSPIAEGLEGIPGGSTSKPGERERPLGRPPFVAPNPTSCRNVVDG